MDSKLLHVFITVVRAGSISGAARQLNFSQPAVSQQIKNLERDLGAQLFTRDGGRLEITRAGQLLHQYAQDILTNWQFVSGQVRAASEPSGRTQFHIGSFPSATTILIEAVEALLHSDPALQIQITEAEPPANFELLRTAQCDALVTFSYAGDQLPRGYQSAPVLTDSFVLIVPMDHPFAGAAQVSLADARHERWIGGCPRCRKELVQFCLEHGYEPDILCSTDDLESTRHLAASGVGVALRPALNVLNRSLPGVAVVGIEDAITRQISVMSRASQLSPQASALARLMRGVAEHLVDGAPPQQRSWFRVTESAGETMGSGPQPERGPGLRATAQSAARSS